MSELHIPVIASESQPTKTKLDRLKRESLYQMTQLPGYKVMLELMEMICILQDAHLMAVDAADEKRVLAEHRITQAQWNFFSQIQKQIAYECNELIGPKDENEEKTTEQAAIEQLLDPVNSKPIALD